jgi:CBS domain-containing protein
MTVQTILSRKGRNVVTIEPSATLQAAIATLAEHHIGAVVVLGLRLIRSTKRQRRRGILMP